MYPLVLLLETCHNSDTAVWIGCLEYSGKHDMGKINWSRTRDILISIICIGVIVYYLWGLLLGEFFHAILLLLLSLAVSFLLTPFVNLLNRYIPRLLATFIAYALTLAVLGGLSYALVFTLIQQVLTFQATVINFFNALPAQLTNIENFLAQNGIPQATITDALDQARAQATSFATSLATNVLNLVFFVTNAIIDVIIILVMSFYFTLDGKHIRNSLMSIVPERSKPHVQLFEDALNRVVGNYIRGQLTLAVIIGFLAGIGSAIFGLSGYALIIGVLAFIFETIPMVGPTLASIPALLISLLLPDPFPRTFWILIYFVAVQLAESNILGPRIVGHAVGLHPVASLLALIIGVQLFGAFGALIATPVVAAAWVVIASLYRSLVLGETADEILAHKRRTPWVFRPPNALRLHIRRTRTTPSGKLEVIEIPPEEQEEASTPLATEASKTGVQFPRIKSANMRIDQIDLLRPVPDAKEAPADSSEEHE